MTDVKNLAGGMIKWHTMESKLHMDEYETSIRLRRGRLRETVAWGPRLHRRKVITKENSRK